MATKRIKKALPIVLIAILLVGALTISLVSFIPSVSEITVLAYDNIRQEDFSIENAVVLFKYKDGREKTTKITADMLSGEDLAKLSTSGKHTVTINYAKNKSILAEINLLKSTSRNAVFDKILQGLQTTAVYNNINGEFAFSAFYQKEGEQRREYTLSLKFTLDVDKNGGAENYLGVEITEDSKVLLGIYYKDSVENRPDFYLKSDGPFVQLMDKTEKKLKSVSADEYFGVASVPAEDEFWTLDGIIDKVLTLTGNPVDKGMVELVMSLLLPNGAISTDGKVATIDLNFNNIVQWIPLAALTGGTEQIANNFLDSIAAGFTLDDALSSGIPKPPLMRLKAFFDDNGSLLSLNLVDTKDNKVVDNALSISIENKIDAAFHIKSFSIKADDTSFSLPTDKGIENWEESDVSFERWVLHQYNRMMGQGQSSPNLSGVISWLNIDYVGEGSVYNMLDVYRPTDTEAKLPVIINIHGGGWTAGSKEGVFRYSQYLAKQGFAVVNINYHLLPHGVMPKPIQDIFAVFNFVMDEGNASKYGFDIDNIFLTGDSAGGHYVMLALSVLLDEELSTAFGVESDIVINAANVNSTGFTFTEVLKIPLPFAHFYVNQFFSDDLPYTAYRDDPRYQVMANALNLENNKLERFPPMFVSSAYGDNFSVHSDRLVKVLKEKEVEYIYDFRERGDQDNPQNYFLGHDFNVGAPDWQVSKAVNNAISDFFKSHLK